MPSIITKSNDSYNYFRRLNLEITNNPDVEIVSPNPSIKLADVRGLMKNYLIKPLYLNYHYLVIHSAHQMSKESQSALLKPLEDCPPYTTFLLCTSSPHTLLDTVRSRCLIQYETSSSNSSSNLKEIDPKDNSLVSIKIDTFPNINTLPDSFTKPTAINYLHQLYPLIIDQMKSNNKLPQNSLIKCLEAEQSIIKNVNPTIVMTDLILQLSIDQSKS